MEITLENGEVVDRLAIENYQIIQNENYYRFTSDSVLLSRFPRAKAGDRVADFCAGSGIVGLQFYALQKPFVKSVTFFEMQDELAQMSQKTVELNDLTDVFSVVTGKIQDIPKDYNEYFSLILCNPPYEKGGFENKDEKKAMCRKELFLTLPELLQNASRCLKFGGRLALCHRADRVAEVIYVLKEYNLECKRLQFVAGKTGDKPYLVLVEAVKGGKAGVEVLPTLANTTDVIEK